MKYREQGIIFGDLQAMKYLASFSFGIIILALLLFYSCTQTPTPPPVDPPVDPVDQLQITSIAPTTGSILSVDTINGKFFSANISENEVFYNGQSAQVLSASTTQLIVRVPLTTTTGTVSVKVNGKAAQGPVFTVLANIIITSINPTSGYPGTLITINGTGFSAVKNEDTVWVGGVKTPVLTAAANKLTITAPVNSTTGRVDVAVKKDYAAGPVFTYLNPGNDSVFVTTFAGSGLADTLDGVGTAASFGFLWDIASDNTGNLYVADPDYNRIRKITPGGIVSTLAGKGSLTGSGGTFFNTCETVTVDNSTGYVYTLDKSWTPLKVITAPETVSTITTSGNYYFQSYYTHNGIASDNNGNIYVAHSFHDAIYKVNNAGFISLVAGGFLGDQDGTGIAAKFSVPDAIAVDHRNGNLFVADMGNFRVKKVTPAGVVTTLAGGGNPAIGGPKDGWGTSAVFGLLYGIAVDGNGNIFVSDGTHHMIRKITPDGYVSTIAGTGAEGLTNGPGKSATFKSPTGLAFDNLGNLYVADGDNRVIRKIVFKH